MFRNDITKSGMAEQRMESALTNYDGATKRDQTYNSTFVFAFEMASHNETFAKMYAYDALEDLVVTNRQSIQDFSGMIASHFLHVNLGHLQSNALGLGVLGVMFEHIHSRRFLILSVLTALALGIVVDIIVPITISPRSINATLLWLRWAILFDCGFSGILNHLLVLSILDPKIPSLARWWAYIITLMGISTPGHVVGLATGIFQLLVHKLWFHATKRKKSDEN